MNDGANSSTNIVTACCFLINELTLKNVTLHEKNTELQQQNDWFKRQIFGEKSEKIIHAGDRGAMEQLWLGGEAPQQNDVITPATTIKEHVRKRCGKEALIDDCGESGLRFDSTVPVEEISCPPEEIKDLAPEDYEVIDTKVTERLCQRSQYYVKRYVRPVVKLKSNNELVTAPAAASVFERSYADVTLLAGVLVDKFQYYLPLFRQHQRMTQSGIKIARGNLTRLGCTEVQPYCHLYTMRCSPQLL